MNDIGLHQEDWGSHFVMVNDINLAQFTGTQFNIIGEWINWFHPDNKPFTGIFDGNGFTISNLTYKSNDVDCVGLFSFVDDSNAVLKDLTLIYPNINTGTGKYVGSLVGLLIDATVTNCYVEGGQITGDYYIGGLGGYCGGTISNCYATVCVYGNEYTGGLVGNSGGTISNCYATGAVEGNEYTAGLVGCHGEGTISDCYATGTVSGNKATGGFVGWNGYYGTISDCYATGEVSGDYKFTGGFVAYNSYWSTIQNCYATGPVDGNDWTGGFAGNNIMGSLIENCYATGQVSGRDYTGGLVGKHVLSMISDCYATGDVDGNDYTGGLAGKSQALIENCYATGDVDGNDYTGGLAGQGGGSNCYATGNVNGNDYTGGLVGYGGGSNCYATGNVNGNDYTGGLVGWGGYISNSYAAGDVNGSVYTGGLVGYDIGGSYTKCFWDSDVNPDVNGIGNTTDPNVIGETTANMQTESTFTSAGWDFNTPIWKMCYMPDYPHLWWEQCPRPSLEMPMHFTPRMLNPKSKGKWIKAHFTLPEGFVVEDVNTNNPAKIVEPFMADPNYMDVFINEDGLVEIEAAFDRAVFCSNGSMLEDIVVIAQLTTGRYFYGTDTIKIKTNNLEYLTVLTSYWLEAGCAEPHWCEGSDINQDGTVDFIDFAIFDGCCLEFTKN